MDVELKGDSKPEKALKLSLDPVGSLNEGGSSLKVVIRKDAKAVVFGLKTEGVGVYDFIQHRQIEEPSNHLKERFASLD